MGKKEILFLEDFPLFSPGPKEPASAPVQEGVDNYANLFKELLAPILKDSSIFLDSNLYKKMSNSLEKTLIETVLSLNHNNQVQSAKVLGISRNTLRSRMKEYGLK
jgi:DNA-binding protein Fis